MDMVEKFLVYLKMYKNISEHTKMSYYYDLKDFYSYCQKEWVDIKKKNVQEYLYSVVKKGNSPSTSRRKLSSLKSFYRFLEIKEGYSENPMHNIAYRRKEHKLPHILSKDDLRLFLNYLEQKGNFYNKRNRFLVEMIYFMGLRISEILSIKLEDIDHSTWLINIHGKGNKIRNIPINDQLKILLKRYLLELRKHMKRNLDKNDRLFINRYGRPITPRYVQKLFYQSSNALFKEGNKITPHSIRHCFATHLMERGIDIKVIQELLGHSSISTTQLYTHLSKDQIRKIYSMYHPLSQK